MRVPAEQATSTAAAPSPTHGTTGSSTVSTNGSQPKPKPKHSSSKPLKSVKKSMKHAASLLIPSDHDYRWEELQEIEKRRRAILQNVEEPTWKVLLHWDGTVLRILAWNPLLWITMATYVCVRLFARDLIPEYMGQMTSDSMTVLGGFLSFFLVFYVNQNHKRFFGLYSDSMACKGRIFDVATLAVNTLPFQQAHRLVRYMNAAHAAGYVGLSEIYPSKSYFKHINQHLGLLTEEEQARLNDINLDMGGSCNREIIVWCIREIQTARAKGLLDPELANQFREQILKLRASLGKPYDAKDLPIPFFYVHFICLLTTLYLPLFAVTSAMEAGTGEETHWSAGIIKGLVVLLQAIFVIGLRVLGQKMSDPYGDDLIDLSVMYYVHFTWTHSNRILKSHFPEEASTLVETDLVEQRPESVGKAWEPQKETQQSTTGTATATDHHSVFTTSTDSSNICSRIIRNPQIKSFV
ncbi:expressed unknown protein [Seminavis robusta]|uniref:Bestrophin homolog n=1 Tax=Seminavis robusta TaxID=568900 RepID=A0A9N8HH57_9STRA|nr:expressed unknown protein [Seminavis robusta]|eukprot:Sro520_g159120.1 n/a (466) ;mRNA; f:16828-18303